jgi:membrane-associated protease RseP (regulator of RpoE activity)
MGEFPDQGPSLQNLLESMRQYQAPPPPAPRKFPWLNILLFLLTLISTMFFGAYMVHYYPDMHRFWFFLKRHPDMWLDGLPFSVTLMVILLSHELGHYFFSRHHNVQASLPYFIPAPNFIGTFGAVIFMKGKIRDRRALLDIGAAGPLAGFVVSLFALYVGLKNSQVIPLEQADGLIMFGPNRLIMWACQWLLPPLTANDAILSPIMDAAWVGFFVTMLNLLPIGQLDGGHIAYACLGEKTTYLSWTVLALMIAMGGLGIISGFFIDVLGAPLFWEGWLFFALFTLLLMGPRGVKHPPPLYPEVRLDWFRWLVALVTAVVFFLIFSPTPFAVMG